MTPDDWAEVFRAGSHANFEGNNSPALVLTMALYAMEDKCREIGQRRPRSDAIKITPSTVLIEATKKMREDLLNELEQEDRENDHG
jgi:hypothetical protein